MRKFVGLSIVPFTKRWLYFDRIFLNEEIYQWLRVSGLIDSCPWSRFNSASPSASLISDTITPLDPRVREDSVLPVLAFEGLRCRTLFSARATPTPSITREDVFRYLYALLHYPAYRERFAANLKRELPRIPFAPDFHAFAEAGRELARLHVDYESLQVWPLKAIEDDSPSPTPNGSPK